MICFRLQEVIKIFKKRSFDNYRHLLDDIDIYGLGKLEVLSYFLSWSGKSMSQQQFRDYSNAITAAQIANPKPTASTASPSNATSTC